MKEIPVSTGYSAYVRLHLVVGDRSLELGQIGPDDVILREVIEVPPGPAEVVMHVDDFERRWQVYLPDGITANSRQVKTVQVRHSAQAAQ